VELLNNGAFFGQKADWIQASNEFQKRGLIHTHLMLQLKGEQPITPQDIDKLVCARAWIREICPQSENGGCSNESTLCISCKLRKLVTTLMTHSCRKAEGGCRDPNCKKNALWHK
jgi:hypothetical protein